jgi:hypothetical protein
MMAAFFAPVAVVFSGVALLLCFLYIVAYRPVLFLSFFFILFGLVWRTASTMYIDLAGPVWSSQTMRYVGPGLATPVYVLAYFTTLIPFLIVLKPRLIESWFEGADTRRAPKGIVTLSDATVVLSSLFLGFLLFDLVRRGSIPLFAHLERFVYTTQYAGAAHRWLVQYGNFLNFWWGLMFAAERLRNRRTDFRYLGLLGLLLLYMFLTGNRFSAFFSFSSFFIIPLAAAIAANLRDRRSNVPFYWVVRAFSKRDLIIVGAACALIATIMAIAIFNNLVNVRGSEDPEALSRFLERLLIQPSELGWISYERVFNFGQWQPARVYDFLFQMPLDAGRNTTPQYLMLETIGEPRTYEHISGGSQFAGGFPEIFFELFGPFYAWLFIFGGGYIAALLTALIIKSAIRGRYASAFLSLYVLYGLFVMYIGGMLNFATTPTYWIKIAALVLALVMEAGLARIGLTLIPWALVPIPFYGRLSAISESLKSKFRPRAAQ